LSKQFEHSILAIKHLCFVFFSFEEKKEKRIFWISFNVTCVSLNGSAKIAFSTNVVSSFGTFLWASPDFKWLTVDLDFAFKLLTIESIY
jgi:hypothetical protein